MRRISDRLAARRRSGGKALVAYVTAGDPSLEESPAIVRALAEGGADLIELGVPWTDPSADGPAIQAGMQRALAGGATLGRTLELVRRLRDDGLDTPIVLFGYYNPLLQRGPQRVVSEAAAAGVDGLLVVDLPPEESEELAIPARARGLDLIPLLAPTSTSSRIRLAAERASGFVYYVSLTGVTGAALLDVADAARRVSALREQIRLPIAVGFGVGDPATARRVAEFADAVVVGSAFVRAIEGAVAKHEGAADAVRTLACLLADAVHGIPASAEQEL